MCQKSLALGLKLDPEQTWKSLNQLSTKRFFEVTRAIITITHVNQIYEQ